MIKMKDTISEAPKKQISQKEAQEMVLKILKDRWGNVEDMEQYFVDKSKEFLNKLKRDIEKTKHK